MYTRPIRIDPDVEISRVLGQMDDYYNDRKYLENQVERAKRVPKYATRHEFGCNIWDGRRLTAEEQEELRAELNGEIKEYKRDKLEGLENELCDGLTE